ncbi:MAG TPA: segregation/condensation protein A [Candidatus Magasanikbacteria bacterium]|nr:segregation/condensation protein A [Candidatus Magasanikbacteria bacterium]
MKEVKLEKFTGPLDLLLGLIEEEKMEISEVSISQVTEQFFVYLNALEEKCPEELSDFLVVATRLVYLKSKNLLPYLLPEEDEGPDLADQLRLYKMFVKASVKIDEMWNGDKLAYGRFEPPIRPLEFVLPQNADLENLRIFYLNLLKRLKPADPLPQVKIDRSISVKKQIESIYNLLKTTKKVSFSEIIKGSGSRTEVIVNFLALLELIKAEKIFITQNNSFEDIEINKI